MKFEISDILVFQMKWLGAGNVPVSSTNNTVLNNSGNHLQVSNLKEIFPIYRTNFFFMLLFITFELNFISPHFRNINNK